MKAAAKRDAAIFHDAHPATLGWLGSVMGQRTRSLGVEHFGETGTVQDLYRPGGD